MFDERPTKPRSVHEGIDGVDYTEVRRLVEIVNKKGSDSMDGIIKNLHWYSDWNGDEVGYPEVLVVGFYYSEALDCHFYVNTETMEIIEIMIVDPDEETY